MLDFIDKQKYKMQEGLNRPSGNPYYYGNEASQMQMQHCPPPPHGAPNMFKPHGYLQHGNNGWQQGNNGWPHGGVNPSSGGMGHGYRGRPNPTHYSQYGGGRVNAGGMMMAEVQEEESFYEVRTSPAGMGMQERHYEHSNRVNHGTGMGYGAGHYGAGVNGCPRSEWVAKGL